MVDRLAADRRVLLFDMLGYGLSEKPDQAYTFALQADIATAYLDALGVDRLDLLTHDVGDTLGGELLARQLEGGWEVEITDRAVTNGSIYMELTQLSAGQRFLLEPARRAAARRRRAGPGHGEGRGGRHLQPGHRRRPRTSWPPSGS